MAVAAKTSILPFRRGLDTGQVDWRLQQLYPAAFFAAISGVSVATAATIGVVAIPEMIERGYNKKFVYGLLAAGGTLGILIPPSLPMIVYGFITEESVIALFLAGIGPGVFLIGLFILFSIIYAHFFGGYTPSAPASWQERRRSMVKVAPTIGLASLILGGIYTRAYSHRPKPLPPLVLR
jgi:C4-dicarboxylate transporter DctM subunit